MDGPALTSARVRSLHRTLTNPAGEEERRPYKAGDARLTKYDVGWRRIVRNFSPSWFSVPMGTGIVACFLFAIPWRGHWLYILSIIFFVLNVILWFAAFIISVLRYTLYPEIWMVMIRDTNSSLFLGTVPIGFATIVEMWVFVCVPAYGEWAVWFAWALWMLDATAAVTITLSLGFVLVSASDQRGLNTIIATQLLPISASVVAAGTGSEVAEVIPNAQYQLGTLIAAYVIWGMAIPMAMSVLVMYYQRLVLHKLPPREVIVSCFLPLGPLGYGGYTILYLGKVARKVFPETDTIDPLAGQFAYVLGLFAGLILWGWGLVWFWLAIISIHKSRPFPFNMGWWGFTFPLGAYAVSTLLIGESLPSLFFRVLGTIFGTAVILLWMLVALGTARGAWHGELFNAPCLKNVSPGKRSRREAGDEEQARAVEPEESNAATDEDSAPRSDKT